MNSNEPRIYNCCQRINHNYPKAKIIKDQMQTRQTNMIFIEKCSPFIGTFFRTLFAFEHEWLISSDCHETQYVQNKNERICCYTLLKPANKTRLNTFDSLCFQRGLNPICSVFESSHIWFHWYSNKFCPKWAKKPVKQALKTPKYQIYSLLLCALLGFLYGPTKT